MTQPMEGILCVDKPPAHTSFDVVARMRKIAGTKKIGHGGTLDPMATGVLPLFFGRAAKACDVLPDQDKRYTAAFRLGVSTDTQDITGAVLRERPVAVGRAQVEAALPRFLGPQMQTPPMYSAVKVNGKRLYELARVGVEVERPAREITVHSIALTGADAAANEYTLDVACSKGTYIRTLCHDLGEALGCGAALTALRRTRACGFGLERCVTLEQAAELASAGLLAGALLPVEAVFASLPRLTLNAKLARHFCNGVALSLNQFERPVGGRVAVYRKDGVFLGLAAPDDSGICLRQERLFYLGE